MLAWYFFVLGVTFRLQVFEIIQYLVLEHLYTEL